MKSFLLISFIALSSETLCSQVPIGEVNTIIKVKVYAIPKDQKRFIEINERNIKTVDNVIVFEILDSICLNDIQKSLSELEELKNPNMLRSIYMLCEVTYNTGLRKSISFESAPSGCIKVNGKIFIYDKHIEARIISCSLKSNVSN